MTIYFLYTFSMNNSLLSVSPFLGLLWLVILLITCFVFVHVVRLARLGRRYQKQQYEAKKPQQNTPTPTETKNPSEKKNEEPIYYIVERKRRVKSSFTEPKQNRFK